MTETLNTKPRLKLKALPTAKRYQKALRAALHAGTVDGLSEKRSFVAAGPDEIETAIKRASEAGAVPLLVVEGPTPYGSRRLPPSLVTLPLALDMSWTETGSNTLLADSVLAELSSEIAEREPDSWGDYAWPPFETTFEQSGEKEPSSTDVLGFQDFATGAGARSTTKGFWQDLLSAARSAAVNQEHLASLIQRRYCAWFSPYTGLPISPVEAQTIGEIILENWQQNDLISHCYGAQHWNHPAINATFSGKNGDVHFHDTQQGALDAAAADNGQVLSWAGRTDPQFESNCQERSVRLLRIEDGFLRSVGLGAGLARGAMLAVDDSGIYYDPSRPSRLEQLLSGYDLSDDELERGRSLVQLIKAARVSKYNFGKPKSFSFPSDKMRILVPGQVADDAAIRKSRSSTIDCVNTPNVNLDLLRLARERHPDAFVVFKPHPDVETGLRKGKVEREIALQHADEVASDANIIDLIEAVDCVETFSSLSGFEALLRDKRVIVHGAPFYAGWGLCEDLTEIEGRSRRRTLPELVYLALVKYARTIDPVSLLPCSPEFLVQRLVEQKSDKRHLLVTALKRHSSWLGRKLGI
ncbi:MAG: hypothetical protein JJ979_22975 [Roseibium sp.]|nr:hypothetical protein [Roseibium sp.]